MFFWLNATFMVLSVGIATVADIRETKIPNWLVYASFLAAVVFHVAEGGLHGLLYALYSAVVTMPIPFIGFWFNQMGAGDFKLYAALGAWIGTVQWSIAFVVLAIMANAVITFLALFIMPEGRKKMRAIVKREKYTYALPHAPAMAVGIVFTLMIGGIH